MPYLPQFLEDSKIKYICSGCFCFIEEDLSCTEKKELYRDYVTNCCKFYYVKNKREERVCLMT